jgi:pimeloyl-ACP methyl ester carboxylesterase
MSFDITSQIGDKDKPACIFIHGLGMDEATWTDPPRARILGGLFPMTVMLRGYKELKTLYHEMGQLGFSVFTWSQQRPVGPAEAAVEELREVVQFARRMGHPGIILIGHSRGGLIARKFLEETPAHRIGPSEAEAEGKEDPGSRVNPPVKALVTLATPHHGSSMARWAVFFSPVASYLKPLVSDEERGTLARAVKRSLLFLESTGVRELLPDSLFLRPLKDSPAPQGAYCLSAGGTSPSLISVAGLFSIPDSLGRLLPARMLPEEMTEGRGDGLVSVESSVLPYGDEHLEFHVNHPGILVDPAARNAILERILKVTDSMQ